MKLERQTAVITGGAKGIGLATAQALVERGARAVLVDTDVGALEHALKLLGSRARSCKADVTSAADMARVVEEAAGAFGSVDIWVNNAGLARHRWITDYTEAEIDLMLAVNLKGTILGSQAALRHMKPAKRGHIINVISTASLRGVPSETVYCAAKWGVRGFTQGLQEEAAPHGIRVTAVLPGGVATDFWQDASTCPAPMDKFLRPSHIADGIVRALEMDDFCVMREVVLRSLEDSDFSVQP
jgi:NAD(P)-dependent dehydrogenase (short-subunit alcohol dehydrogenase family)